MSTEELLKQAQSYQAQGRLDEAWVICVTLLALCHRGERKMKDADFRIAIDILLDEEINTCVGP